MQRLLHFRSETYAPATLLAPTGGSVRRAIHSALALSAVNIIQVAQQT